jgi:hypothetical protein
MFAEKLTNKLLDKSPASRWLEKKTGIRPHGPMQLLGKDVGQGKNRFYQPGGSGYAGPAEKFTPKGPAAHVSGIAARRLKGGGQI